ncbi:MAG: biotin--[acetyl-CoA-carboxylase] ligase [Deltaproteobacteria bacterium]|nr:biotin--[acetyl-CoA-carboxylase] ligase [Deltaproteobacteria bacterium]
MAEVPRHRAADPGQGLVAAAIEAELVALGASLGRPVEVAQTTPSTNDDAKRAADEGAPHGAAFLADSQTHGRGRGKNEWHSPGGQNLYLSVVLRPELDPAATAPLALAAGVSVAQVVDALLPTPRAMLKWPNDVYVDERKLAGVLVEATSRPGRAPVVVIGVGLNVLTERFPAWIAPEATSLTLAGAQDLDRNIVAARLIHALGEVTRVYEKRGVAALIDELTRRDFLRGRTLEVGKVAGTGEGIDAQGRLVVRGADGGIHAVCSGEVRWQ